MLTVVLKLRRYGIHHMPVLGPEADGVGGASSAAAASASLHAGSGGGNGGAGLSVLAVLSYKSLLEHLVSKFTDADSVALLEQPLLALGVGSFGADILVVPETASVVSVLHVLAERRVSSVPVVAADGSGVLVDVYSREDVAFLANDPTLMVLDAPVGDVRRAQISMTGIGSNLLTCSAMDSLAHALTLFAAAGGRAERIVCVDSERRVTGIVSLSDLFAYICSDESLPGALHSPDEGPGSSAAAAVGLGMGLGGF